MTPTEFRHERLRLGLTQHQIALAFGVTIRMVKYWENVKRNKPIPHYAAKLIAYTPPAPPRARPMRAGRKKIGPYGKPAM